MHYYYTDYPILGNIISTNHLNALCSLSNEIRTLIVQKKQELYKYPNNHHQVCGSFFSFLHNSPPIFETRAQQPINEHKHQTHKHLVATRNYVRVSCADDVICARVLSRDARDIRRECATFRTANLIKCAHTHTHKVTQSRNLHTYPHYIKALSAVLSLNESKRDGIRCVRERLFCDTRMFARFGHWNTVKL